MEPLKIENECAVCTHDELVKEQPSYVCMNCQVHIVDQELPEYIMYSPYICKKCGKRYLVLQAVVEEKNNGKLV